MTADREQLERAIAAQESLRGVVPDDVLEVAVGALRRQLTDLDAAASRRRQVTVLFADVSGFTAMSERMDAELVAGMMNDIWARFDVVVTEHGGRVDKHIGDAVMAVWGSEGTHEDDPERAVRAGLSLQSELAAFNAHAGVALAMRVGVSTGLAHLGAVGTTAESTVMGDTVNLASRLEHLAPINGVLISHETYRSVRGVFDVQPLGEVEVRGKRELVRLYLVERAKPRAFRLPTRGVEGVETRTIGRDDELRVLRDSFGLVADGGGAAIVVVVADAGTGKSRLLYEFLNWLELLPSSLYMFTGRALAIRRGAAMGLFRDVIATRFDMHDSDSAPTVAEKLRRGFAPCLSAEEAEIVGHWLGFELSSSAAVQHLLGPQFAATARTHLLEFFGSLAATDPVVLALEDLHWADDESLDLLDELTSRLRERGVLVVALTRPSLLDRRHELPGRDVPVVRLDLAPLSNDDCRTLVLDVLQRFETIPAELVELVVERAEGNAFYVEELIKMLIDDGAIVTSSNDGVWRVDLARLQRSAIPSTLTGVLQARLDTLDARHRRTLQCASVVGRVFWDDAVSALTRDEDVTTEALDDARSRELVFRRDHTSFEHADEYLFKHALLCDVTYETVLLRDRPMLHARAAEWLESAAGERMVEYREMIAGHLRAAGEPGRAAEHLWHAGQTLLATGTPGAAARSLRAAVELWDTAEVDAPCDALLELGEALLRVDDFGTAETFLERARSSAATPSQRVDVARLMSWIAAHRGDLDLELSLLEGALPLAEQADTLSRTRILIALAWSYSQAGRLDDAGDHALRALTLAEELGDVGETCRALAASAMVRAECGDFEGSQRLVERELAIAERSANLDEQARAQCNLGAVRHLRGDAEGVDEHYRAAIDHYQQSRALHQRLGAEPPIRERLNMAQACTRLGRDDEARVIIRESLATAVDESATSLQFVALLSEADRRLVGGDTQTGLAYLGMLRRVAAMGSMDHHEAERILDRVRLPHDAIEVGLAAGEALDLDSVIREVLADSPNERGGCRTT